MNSAHEGNPSRGGKGLVLSLRAGLALSRLSLEQLWIAQLSRGGDLAQRELTASIHGTRPLSDYQHDVIAHALNDHLAQQGLGEQLVAYRGRS